MVECSQLDVVFESLADGTRRDILRRVSKRALSIREIAKPYKMSFSGVAKHVDILHDAGLVMKKREGKFQIISLKPTALRTASVELMRYAQVWEDRFTRLDELLTNT